MHEDIPPVWQELIERARYEEDVTLIDELEFAIRDADSQNHLNAAFQLRNALIGQCQEGGRPDLILAHYPWCLARLEQAPEDERFSLLFRYRWAISQSMDYPTIGRERIEELIADMSQRYEQEGFSQRSVWVLRILMRHYWHDEEGVKEAIDTYWRHRRDALCDSTGTEQKFISLARLNFWPEEYAEMITTIGFDDPTQRCTVKSALVMPLLLQGKRELAEREYQAGYPLAKADATRFVGRASFAWYLGMTGRFDQAYEIITKDLDQAIASIEISDIFDFFANAAWVLRQAPADDSLESKVKSTHPACEFPEDKTNGSMAAWCQRRAESIADTLDVHNNCRAYWTDVQAILDSQPLSD